MHSITPFQFDNETVRVVTVDGEPWFVAKDVCEALGFLNRWKAVADHVDQEDRNTLTIREGNRGNPNQTIVNESGLYALIFGSRLESAARFKRWVTSEVLPTIRKTGGYSLSKTPAELLLQQAQMLVEQERRQKAIEERQDRLERRQDQIETGIDHFTVVAYARMFLKTSLPLADAARIGKAATHICNELGIPTGVVPDPRFGRVNTYPKSVLDDVFAVDAELTH